MSNFKLGVAGGAGWLGSVIVNALLQTESLNEGSIGISYRRQLPLPGLPVFKTTDNQHLADWSDVIMVSVRPHDWPALMVDAKGKLVISIMAGVPIDDLCQRMNTKRVIRALPNVAAEIGQSYTPWTGSPAITDDDRAIATAIFKACGISDEVGTENDIDYLTGFSGSGPAYPALLADVMSRHAIAFGIKPEIAIRAALQTMIGAGRLFEQNSKAPSDIVQEFVDYKGIIAAAIDEMRAGGIETAIEEGLNAGLRKSRALQTKH